MYYFREGGKQILDLTGNLILSFNDSLVKCRAPSAAPDGVKNAKKIMINELTFIKKIWATFVVLGYIWGVNKALVESDTALNKPYRKDKQPVDFPLEPGSVSPIDPDKCQCDNGGNCNECPR